MGLFKRVSLKDPREDHSIDEPVNANLANLFVDSSAATATYVESPQDAARARDLPKPNATENTIPNKMLFTSPVSLGKDGDSFDTPPNASHQNSLDSEPKSKAVGEGRLSIDEELSSKLKEQASLTDEPKSTSQGPSDSSMKLEKMESNSNEPSSSKQAFGSSSRRKSSKLRSNISVPISPLASIRSKTPSAKYSPRRPTDVASIEGFETALEDDETFMIEEATRRDIRLNQTSAADAETATVLFKRRNGKKNEDKDVDMSAEEILRTQRWGRGAKKGPPRGVPMLGSPKLGSPKLGSPKLGSPGRSRGKRPPPLIPALGFPDTPTSASTHSNVFGQDGGFSDAGFEITSGGIQNKPRVDVREDNVATLRTDQLSGVQMRSLAEFRKGPTIGAGAAGRVYLALHEPTSLAVAMKTVNVFDSGLRSQLMKELLTLSRHVSRYLVRFYGAFYDGSGAVHIALEFMDRGCLDSFVRKNGAIPEHVVRVIAVDCARGLRFLHKHHVLHRDFKTANILLSREQCCAKISDFGLARDMNSDVVSRVNTFVGTVAYMSPERLQGSEYTYASDVWALGVSLAECFLGRYPFDKPQNYFDYIDATHANSLFSDGKTSVKGMSENARSFIVLTTDPDPKKRPTAENLLEHPWLKDFVPNKGDRMEVGRWIDEVSGKETPRNKILG